jgi:integration host factor subunit alpha
MTLTKADITDGLYNITDLKRPQAKRAVETFLEIIKSILESGEDVLISGFGKFQVKEQTSGSNFQTEKDMILEPKRVVTFQWSPRLKGKLNRGKER